MIDVRGLGYTYDGAERPALRDLEFTVEDGEVFGFLGPSGAGKSTTQKVLTGLLEDYIGEVTVLNREVRAWNSDLYERIGIATETPTLYRKLTGRENLQLFASLHGESTRDPLGLLERVGIAEAADDRVGTYSKGMRMRLNFVRALLHQPELLFLDEPTAGIDPGNARRVMDFIEDLNQQGTTFFLTTHDMTVADRLCDRVGFIVNGRLVEVGTPRVLKLEHGDPTVRIEYSTDGGIAEQSFPLAGLGENETFHRLMRCSRIETIHSTEATLEDVFIEVTGRELT